MGGDQRRRSHQVWAAGTTASAAAHHLLAGLRAASMPPGTLHQAAAQLRAGCGMGMLLLNSMDVLCPCLSIALYTPALPVLTHLCPHCADESIRDGQAMPLVLQELIEGV
jgi:hypothetical protein